jgi:6-phosphogluconolactonase
VAQRLRGPDCSFRSVTPVSGAPREVLEFDLPTYAEQTATLLEWVIRDSVLARGVCRLVLAGGRTPGAVYRALAKRPDMPWQSVEAFIGDERCVLPTDADSNYRMIAETLLDAVPIPGAQIHRLRGELGAEAAAAEYDALLSPLPEPKFDLVLTGVGADGHTASLFPGDPLVTTTTAWAMSAVAPPPFAVAERVGLSLRALCSSRVLVVLCTGEDKRAIRAAILSGAPAARLLPAALVSGIDRTICVVDPM